MEWEGWMEEQLEEQTINDSFAQRDVRKHSYFAKTSEIWLILHLLKLFSVSLGVSFHGIVL